MLKSPKLFLVILGFCLFGSALAKGQDLLEINEITAHFSGDDPSSKGKVDYYPLSYYLNNAVLFVGRSRGFLGNEKPETYRNSKIAIAQSLEPSRFENSRILFHMLEDEHKVFFRDYKKGLETLSNSRAINSLNQTEQLAYWLNLYNLTVLIKIIEEYPISRLDGLRSDNPAADDFWNEKTMVVEGILLSLRDVEAILFANFKSPLVAFGLWQGSIGGPRIRNLAYSSDNVYDTLANNADEFVNSNRGLRPPRKNHMAVSKFFEWMMPAFGNSPEHVLAFIKQYADPNFVEGIDQVNEISFKVYDWQVADVLGGTLHGGLHNQPGGLQTGKTGNSGDVGAGGAAGGLMDVFKMVASAQKNGPFANMPPAFYNLLVGMQQNTKRPIPIITTTECAPGEECIVKIPNDENNP